MAEDCGHPPRCDRRAGLSDPSAQGAHLARGRRQLAERARTETWSYEEFLAACLQREVSARESHGGEGRIRAARFPSRKSLEEFDFDHARGLKRDLIAHLGTLDFVTARDNVVFLGPPGQGKHANRDRDPRLPGWASGLVRHRQPVGRSARRSHHRGTLQAELVRLARYPLLVVDEVGYIPFEPEAANLFFQLVSSRYEQASLIVTSNKPFGRWGEVFGDDVVAAAMIDRLVHHAEVISLKGDSYRIKDRGPRPRPHGHGRRTMTPAGQNSTCRQLISIQLPLTDRNRLAGATAHRALARSYRVPRPARVVYGRDLG